MQKLLLFLSVLFLLSSCDTPAEPQEVVIKDQYKIQVSGSMKPGTELNADASLQYQNLYEELYIVVIDESEEGFQEALVNNGLDSLYDNDLTGYSDLLLLGITMELKNKSQEAVKDTIINGLEARTTNMEVSIDGFGIYYKLAYLKGAKDFYQIMTWCLADKKEKHGPTMDAMIYSFEEL
jgi:hypothetical protein